jgi:hypothetical protein
MPILDLRAEGAQRLDLLKQLAPELLLRGLGEAPQPSTLPVRVS